jgi:hypothetical protein
MRQAVIDGAGRVVNIIIAAADFPTPAGCTLRPATDADVIWTEPVVPASVTRFQARAALAGAGLLASVDAAIAASGNTIAQLAWADAQSFERGSPTIAAMSGALGLTAAQVDDLFRTAAGIVA